MTQDFWEAERERMKASLETFRAVFKNSLADIDPLNFYIPKGWDIVIVPCLTFLELRGAKIFQIKQKLGDLRIYTEGGYDELNEQMISLTCKMARFFCEFCGSVNDVKLYRDGYISRSCASCREKFSGEVLPELLTV
jgi:hypothetical protein